MSLKELAKAVVEAWEKGDLAGAIRSLDAELKSQEELALAHELTIDAARNMYCDGDDIQVDDDAAISESDDGVWVSAWVWVPIEKEPS